MSMVIVPVIKPSVKLLQEVKILRRFTEGELSRLLSIGQVVKQESHANIVIEGEPSWGLYLILEGSVGIYKTNKLSGDNYDIGKLDAGSFFGEMSLIDENPRSATVRAITDCTLFHIPRDPFQQLLASSTDLKLRFYETCIQDLVGRLRELDDKYVIGQYLLWKVAITGEAA